MSDKKNNAHHFWVRLSFYLTIFFEASIYRNIIFSHIL